MNTSQSLPSHEEELAIQKLINEGNLDGAKKSMSDLAERYPNSIIPGYYDAYIKNIEGKYSEAIDAYINLISKSSKKIWVYHYNLGLIYYNLRQFSLSIEQHSIADQIKPNDPNIILNLGAAYYENYQYDEAEIQFNKVISIKPDSSASYCNLASIALQKSQIDLALQLSKKAYEVEPSSTMAYTTYGIALSRKNNIPDLKKSIKYFQKAIELEPNNPDAYANLAGVQYHNNLVEESKKSCEKALAINPNHAIALQNLATYMQANGNKEETEKLYKRILLNRPDNGGIFKDYAHHFNCSSEDDIVKKVINTYNAKKINKKDLSYIAFGLFHIYDREKEYDVAFNYLNEANELHSQTLNIEMNSKLETFNKVINTYTPEFFEKVGSGGCEDKDPIFIVGLPRSGTTLVEQILSSHSKVYGAGEIMALNDTLERYQLNYSTLEQIDQKLRIEIGQEYIKTIRSFASNGAGTEKQFITDKIPQNFIFLGMINLILPNAKIIHIKRNPLDNCISLYSHAFIGGQDYSYNLKNIAVYYNNYVKLMDHWKRVLPNKFYDLSYDLLVDKTEDTIKDLLKYCDLNFEEDCLRFYENKRKVLTPSSSQVRKKMYKSSSGRAKNYEKFLETFKEEIRYSE
ncbi:MAG: hypothetical protein CMD06_00730 [Flavobacteriales bacterium]|nr:hypothetical protein [Flavobacteriales bacterium]